MPHDLTEAAERVAFLLRIVRQPVEEALHLRGRAQAGDQALLGRSEFFTGTPGMSGRAPAAVRTRCAHQYGVLSIWPLERTNQCSLGKRLAGEPVGQPVGHQDRRERPEIGRRHVADRMARFLVDHHLLRPLERPDQPLGMFERAQLLALAGDHR